MAAIVAVMLSFRPKWLVLFFAFPLCLLPIQAQQEHAAATAAAAYTSAHQAELTNGFVRLLAMPNVAADPAGLRQNAESLVNALKQRGADAQLLAIPGAPAVVYGEIRTPGAEHTIVFYAHYDGQPVTASEWATPPFQPTLRKVDGETRVYARSAGDDKAAIFAQLTALASRTAKPDWIAQSGKHD